MVVENIYYFAVDRNTNKFIEIKDNEIKLKDTICGIKMYKNKERLIKDIYSSINYDDYKIIIKDFSIIEK